MTDQRPDLHLHPFFAALPEDLQRHLQTCLERRLADPGQIVLRPGEFGDFLALVQRGRVRLETPGGKAQWIGPGEIFGEGMLRYGVPSSFTAQAEEETVLWLLPRGEWLVAEYRRQASGEAAVHPAAAAPPTLPHRQIPTAKALALQPVQPEVAFRQAPLSPWSPLHGPFLPVLGVLFLAAAILGPMMLPVFNQAVVDSLTAAGRPALGLAYLEWAPVWQPDTADLFDRLGYLRFQQGQVQPSIQAFEQALGLDDELASAHNNLGVALLAAGRAQDALPHLQRTVELDPGNPHAFYNLGNADLATGRLPEAALAYRRAFELDPWQQEARARWAGIAFSQGQVEPASHVWHELLVVNPLQPLANQGLGMLAVWQGQFTQALPYLETARAADPGDPLTRLYLGITLEALDRPQEAAAEYQQVLALSQPALDPAQSAGAPALAGPGGASLAQQAQQRLLDLLPRLAPATRPSPQDLGGAAGPLNTIQKGGFPGVTP